MKIIKTDYYVAQCTCGAEPQVCLSIYDRQKYYFVCCPNCRKMLKGVSTLREAVDKWNEWIVTELIV